MCLVDVSCMWTGRAALTRGRGMRRGAGAAMAQARDAASSQANQVGFILVERLALLSP
jgi:hypothetical protein